MRKITDHVVTPEQEQLELFAVDEPDPDNGNANHTYRIRKDTLGTAAMGGGVDLMIEFQRGPIKEHGVNGITNEIAVAMVIDRLRGFQSGKHSCRENAIALTHFEEGLMWLQRRTRERISRGVEGTSAK